jgi:alpha-tubulin suppressor-like RCC1 family protein
MLGNGAAAGSTTPVDVPGVNSAVSARGSLGHLCVRLADGSARCWGQNFAGQIGDGTTTARPLPTPVDGLTGAREVDADGNSCALTGGGTVVCWGLNDRGQVGDGTTSRRLVPTPVAGL